MSGLLIMATDSSLWCYSYLVYNSTNSSECCLVKIYLDQEGRDFLCEGLQIFWSGVVELHRTFSAPSWISINDPQSSPLRFKLTTINIVAS